MEHARHRLDHPHRPAGRGCGACRRSPRLPAVPLRAGKARRIGPLGVGGRRHAAPACAERARGARNAPRRALPGTRRRRSRRPHVDADARCRAARCPESDAARDLAVGRAPCARGARGPGDGRVVGHRRGDRVGACAGGSQGRARREAHRAPAGTRRANRFARGGGVSHRRRRRTRAAGARRCGGRKSALRPSRHRREFGRHHAARTRRRGHERRVADDGRISTCSA